MFNSCNSSVQTCFMNSLYNSKSVIGSRIAYFRAKYRINFTTSTRSTIMSSNCVTVPTELHDFTSCLKIVFIYCFLLDVI